MADDWRGNNVSEETLSHWERVRKEEREIARKADLEGFRYEYIPWHKARGKRELIGKKVSRAYWTWGFGKLPWGHQHAHRYEFTFKMVRDIGPDWIAYEDGSYASLTSYDDICVQHGDGKGIE